MKHIPPTKFSNLCIGVLELQGDFAEHTAMLRKCGAGKVVGVRLASDLDGIHALVLPGGESTVMSKLLVQFDMMEKIRNLAQNGLPIFGTCAGSILLASEILQRADQPRIGVMNISVDRNAYGAQIDSFEALVKSKVNIFAKGPPLRVVHIRAPRIANTGPNVEVLASHKDNPILVRQENLLACTFHPEITTDTRVHTLFLEMVDRWKKSTTIES